MAISLSVGLQAAETPDDVTRDCVAEAVSTVAIAACERAAQVRWRQQLVLYHEALLGVLSGEAKARYVAAQENWERFYRAELRAIDAILREPATPASAASAEGAKVLLLKRRAEQLADYLNAVKTRPNR